ncbi:hypothetical protein DF186_23200, partial [Enterococcus hirae]
MLSCCFLVGAADIHQYNDYNQYRYRIFFGGLIVGFVVVGEVEFVVFVVNLTVSVLVGWLFYIYSVS